MRAILRKGILVLHCYHCLIEIAMLSAVKFVIKASSPNRVQNYEKNLVKLYRGVSHDHIDFELAKR